MFPTPPQNERVFSVGIDTATSAGMAVRLGNTSSKGSWVQLSSGLPFDFYGGFATFMPAAGTAVQDVLVDLASGSDGGGIFAENIYWGSRARPFRLELPIFLKSGTPIYARGQMGAGSTNQDYLISMHGFGRTLRNKPLVSKIVTMGANTSDSGGSGVLPGSTAHVKSSWYEIASSTSYPLRKLCVCVGDQNNVTVSDYVWYVDIAIGGSGSEKIIIPNLMVASNSFTDDIIGSCQHWFDVSIPASTRIAARAQCSGTDSVDRLIDVILYGGY